MISFYEYFFIESFNFVPPKIKEFDSGDKIKEYYFSLGEKSEYKVLFLNDNGIISVYFENISDEINTHSMGITGTGNALKVFSTVIYLMEKYVKENSNTKSVTFQAAKEDKNRAKLYNRMISSFAKKKNFMVDISDTPEYVEYTLTLPHENSDNLP
jgi:hypothetical protein